MNTASENFDEGLKSLRREQQKL